MVENFALYSQTYDSLPEEQMRELAGEAQFKCEATAEGRTFIYSWPDLSITVNEMPAREVPEHLNGLTGYVYTIYGGEPDERGEQLLERITYTRLVASLSLEPGRDKDGRADSILGDMAFGLSAMIFYESAIFDQNSKLILAPDGDYEEDADVLGPLAEALADRFSVDLPDEEQEPATAAQVERYQKVLQQLQPYKVPTLSYPLLIDDEEVTPLRRADEVASRVIVLSAVTFLADGGDRNQARSIVDQYNLWHHVSPQEHRLLDSNPLDTNLAQQMLWRLEALWVLVWALGAVDLPWPSGFCDVPRLMAALEEFESKPDFIATAQVRPKSEVLDALQLTLLQHWAIRDAYISKRSIPADLNWSGRAEMLPTQSCPAAGAVAERHHALNWLTCFGEDEWDDVDTPT